MNYMKWCMELHTGLPLPQPGATWTWDGFCSPAPLLCPEHFNTSLEKNPTHFPGENICFYRQMCHLQQMCRSAAWSDLPYLIKEVFLCVSAEIRLNS